MGLARVLTPDALISLTPETGSYLYMAPEVVRHDLYATQADVWSWACLACETLSSMRPYAELHLTPVQVALSVAEGGQRPRIPVDCPPAVCELLEAALAFEPLDRPSFAVIAAVMRRVVEEEGSKEKAMKTMNLAGGSWKGWFGRPT
jgi:serine/threonine protein kinase